MTSSWTMLFLCTICVMWHRETNSCTWVTPQYKDSLSVYENSYCRYTTVISFSGNPHTFYSQKWDKHASGLEHGYVNTLITRFMGPTWGPSGADRTQVGPMLAPWTLLSGCVHLRQRDVITHSCANEIAINAMVWMSMIMINDRCDFLCMP